MLAIICAVSDEVSGYLGAGSFSPVGRDQGTTFYESPSEPETAVVVGGIGRRSAEEATARAIDRYSPSLVMSVGFAGGVRLGVNTGDLVVCDRVWSVEGPSSSWTREGAESIALDSYTIDKLLPSSSADTPGISRGECLSVPRVASETSAKASIGAMFPVSVVDMESFWVSQIAAQHDVRSAVARVVLDPLGQTLPSFVDRVAAKGAGGRWQHAVRFALARPGEIPSLFRLMSQVRVARSSLAGFLRHVASQHRAVRAS